MSAAAAKRAQRIGAIREERIADRLNGYPSRCTECGERWFFGYGIRFLWCIRCPMV